MSNNGDIIRMTVEGLVFDPLSNTPIIILKNADGDRSLPIWVGYPEATAIALEMESVTPPRPMTHDLIKNLLNGLEANVNHIVVNDLKNNTFYAIISLSANGGTVEIDSRPSDAIAVALRVNAPIYVTRFVLDSAKSVEIDSASPEQAVDEDQFRKWLNDIKPSDFGKLDQ